MGSSFTRQYVEDGDTEHLPFANFQAHEQFLLNQRTELNFDLPIIPVEDLAIPPHPAPTSPVPHNSPVLIDLPARIREHLPAIALMHKATGCCPSQQDSPSGGNHQMGHADNVRRTHRFMADNSVVMSALTRTLAPSGSGRRRRALPISPPLHTPFHMAHDHP